MATSPCMSGRPVFRFAPSPNGRLHLGHAFSALMNERLAARFGGKLLLRIEDIDLARCRPDYVDGIREDLAWLGIAFDGPVRRQSQHFDDYRNALAALQAKGLIYPCFCSRQRIGRAVAERDAKAATWPRDPDGAPLYPGCCKQLPPGEIATRIADGEAYMLRLAMDRALCQLGTTTLSYGRFDETGGARPTTAAPTRWGDVVLARKDIPTSYHLSVVVDDALQGVTHIVRGRDLAAATDIHVLLQHLLGLPTPCYHFHALLTDDTGQKLAKSRMSQSLAELRASGVTPADIRARLGFP